MSQINYYRRSQQIVHWLMALLTFGLFGVGFWMVDLTYYSAWYQTAPHWHQSIGILLAGLWLVRIAVNRHEGKPATLATHSPVEVITARVVHFLLYGLLLVLFVSGYLISTADGRAIDVFNWFSIPGAGELFAHQADIAGEVHEYTAYCLIALAFLHALGAMKHHFIDKDPTLKRMLGRE